MCLLPVRPMSTSIIEFPLSPLRNQSGFVSEPIIPVAIRTSQGFKLYDFLVDSGADLSVLPKSLAKDIGIDLTKCKKSITLGVEGRGVRIYHTQIGIRLGHWEDTIRCAFANHDQIPPLLGRLDFFSRYNITFHAKRCSILFQRAVR